MKYVENKSRKETKEHARCHIWGHVQTCKKAGQHVSCDSPMPSTFFLMLFLVFYSECLLIKNWGGVPPFHSTHFLKVGKIKKEGN